MITDNGHIKVIDYGSAKILEDDDCTYTQK